MSSAERQTFTKELDIQLDGDPPEVYKMCIGALVWQTKEHQGTQINSEITFVPEASNKRVDVVDTKRILCLLWTQSCQEQRRETEINDNLRRRQCWDGSSDTLCSDSEGVPRRSARCAANQYQKASSATAVSNRLHSPSLRHRRKVARLSMPHEIIGHKQ